MSTRNSGLVILVGVFGLALSACGTFSVGIETQPPTTESPQNNNQTEGQSREVLLPEETKEPETDSGGSLYWSEAEDDRTGLRFAIPCFWEVQIPTLDPSGLGAFSVRNYTEEFVQSHPRGYVWDTGAMKIDFIYAQASSHGLSPGASLAEAAQAIAGDPLGEFEVDVIQEVTVNGQPGLLVTQRRTSDPSDTGQFYLFAIGADLYLLVSAAPEGALDNPDVLGVLHSIALSSEVSVAVPSIIPGDPPEGISAPCLKGLDNDSSDEPLAESLSCPETPDDPVEAMACAIQDALLTRNLDALQSLMADPFVIGYWQSEGTSNTPSYATQMMGEYWLPADTSGLTFTTDRGEFPPLFGMPPENMFGPEVDVAVIIYSEGWEPQGAGAALLYVVRDGVGNLRLYGLVIDGEHFDK
ncbi:MAG: hypothetical protein PVJ07_04035 [Anaerolineales bacterium]|jgi:hypothetical protein